MPQRLLPAVPGALGLGLLGLAISAPLTSPLLAPPLGGPLQAQPLPAARRADSQACPVAEARRLVPRPSPTERTPPPTAPAVASDYRHLLSPTPWGWPRRDHWCLWIEPGAITGPAARWDGRWRQAVQAALNTWSAELPITLVDDPRQAQIQLLRRRPPLRGGRASHGRAELQLVAVLRQGSWQLEPEVLVSISPGQRLEATQATALHELGHAFGIWGHSDVAGDALAAIPGPVPVLELSARDRATLGWLQSQPGLSQPPPAAPAPAAGSAQTVLRAD